MKNTINFKEFEKHVAELTKIFNADKYIIEKTDAGYSVKIITIDTLNQITYANAIFDIVLPKNEHRRHWRWQESIQGFYLNLHDEFCIKLTGYWRTVFESWAYKHNLWEFDDFMLDINEESYD